MFPALHLAPRPQFSSFLALKLEPEIFIADPNLSQSAHEALNDHLDHVSMCMYLHWCVSMCMYTLVRVGAKSALLPSSSCVTGGDKLLRTE